MSVETHLEVIPDVNLDAEAKCESKNCNNAATWCGTNTCPGKCVKALVCDECKVQALAVAALSMFNKLLGISDPACPVCDRDLVPPLITWERV